MTTLQQFSDGLAAAVERVAPTLVTVEARPRQTATGISLTPDGDILTADHVVEHDENIHVRLHDGRRLPATVRGRDPATDLALLTVDAALSIPEWVETLKVGHLVLAVGRPDDLQATLGSVVAIGGPVRSRRHALPGYVQSDVTMYPGFSGGPLIDVSGRVAAINSSALAGGASLGLPIVAARRIAEALRRDGRIKRGFLGVGTQAVRLPEANATALQQVSGLMIINVEKDGPAAQGGLLQGDIIVRVGDHPVIDIEALQLALGPETVGQSSAVKIIRGGAVMDLSIMVGERPA